MYFEEVEEEMISDNDIMQCSSQTNETEIHKMTQKINGNK